MMSNIVAQFFIVGSIFLIGFDASAQTIKCSKIKNGTFESYTPDGDRTVIVRRGNTQTESNKTYDYEAKFVVVWIDDCTYELRNKTLVKGPPHFAGSPDNVLRVEIIEINGNEVVTRLSSNYSDAVMESKLILVE